MAVWSPAFQHQFLDGNLLNFRAAPGLEPDISFEAPTVRPAPPADQLGFPVRRGNRFDYRFEPDVFGSVIGADIKLDLAFPPNAAAAQTAGNVTLANGTVRLVLGFVNGTARVQLFVGNEVMSASAEFDPGAPLRIQARWHTHGQGQIWIDGDLHSYDPALAPGQSFAVEGLAFGHHDTSETAPSAPAFLIRAIRVKLLRDDDAVRVLDGLLPIADPVPVDPGCRRQLANLQRAASAEMRTVMRQAIPKLTSSWQRGMPGGPFTSEAVAAHEAATAAGRAFVAFMLQRPDGDAAEVTQRLDEFLVLIRDADPTAYDEAVERLRNMQQPLDADCRAQLEPVAQAHAAQLGPVVELLETLWTKMQSPGATP